MKLSKSTVAILVDMIENKLAMIPVSDREELHEVVALRRCLAELTALLSMGTKDCPEMATRGRRRKLTSLMDEAGVQENVRWSA